MSSIEIYGFKQNGDAELYGEVKNSWRGALKIWKHLERKYLPQIEVKDYLKGMYERLGVLPSRTETFCPAEGLQEIWDLADSEKVSETDKTVLCTTFNHVVVLKKDIPIIVAAFRGFGGDTNLSEQADILEKLYKDSEMMAVAWNQTSSGDDYWGGHSYDLDKDERIPYNLFKNLEHCYLPENETTHRDVVLKKLNEILIEEGFIGAEVATYELPLGENSKAIIEVSSDNLQTEFLWRLLIDDNKEIYSSDWLDLNEDSYVEMANEEILNLIV